MLEEDTEPREITVPEELRKALESHPEAGALFRQLSYTHQKEYVSWIEEAKREQTRQRRIVQTVQLLTKGKKEQ